MVIASKVASSNPNVEINFGAQGELFTIQWLKEQGYTILAHNYRIKKGEIDIIARKNHVITFVEVKTRSADYFNISQVITLSKQKKIIAAAEHYYLICLNHKNDFILRFDVALLQKKNNIFTLEYIQNAFTKKEIL